MFDIYSAARAYEEPSVQGAIRATPQDFQVIEIPAFQPSGEGEHRILAIRKTELNTAQVAEAIAKLAKLPQSRVSWAGLKDRNAVTEQWFGVYLANNPEPDWNELNNEKIKVLEVHRHQKKLRRGVLKANQFYIRVTHLKGDVEQLKHRYETILDHGVPNYFGEQRFGFRGGNLGKALSMFRSPKRRVRKHERGLYISAARSLIFNAVLDQRVKAGNWNQYLAGDVFQLKRTKSIFQDDQSSDLQKRINDFEIHPTGPLWGRGELPSLSACRELEEAVAAEHQEFAEGIVKSGSQQDRRSLRVEPRFFQMQLEKDAASFSFELPSGSYATAVLRELVKLEDPAI